MNPHQRGYNREGLLDETGRKKAAFDVLRDAYREWTLIQRAKHGTMNVTSNGQRKRIERINRLERKKRIALLAGSVTAISYVLGAIAFASAYPELLLGVPLRHSVWLLGGFIGSLVGGIIAGGHQWDRGAIVGIYIVVIAVGVLVSVFVGYHLVRLYLQRGLFFGYLIPFYGSLMGLIMFTLFFFEGALGGVLGNFLHRGISRLS